MAEMHTYCVYFHPQALEVLGESIAPYLSDGPAGKFVLCKEIDTGGSFCEMQLVAAGSDGQPTNVELMVPTGMIRMVISTTGSDIDFGFA